LNSSRKDLREDDHPVTKSGTKVIASIRIIAAAGNIKIAQVVLFFLGKPQKNSFYIILFEPDHIVKGTEETKEDLAAKDHDNSVAHHSFQLTLLGSSFN